MRNEHYEKILAVTLVSVLVVGTVFFCTRNREAVAALGRIRTAGETVVIDAGHGGEDGGAVSVSGVPESGINLAIALKLDHLFGLYGVHTHVLRTEDKALYDSDAVTLREKKVSDLHNRVAIIKAIPNATLISIHQNIFENPKYHGAQVFYANADITLPFAKIAQEMLRSTLDPSNTRVPTRIPDSVYLMNHIACRAILVECGFLSNPDEDRMLQTAAYQTRIATALAGAYLQFQDMPEEPTTKGDVPNED